MSASVIAANTAKHFAKDVQSDLAIQGITFSRIIMADVTIRSPLAPSAMTTSIRAAINDQDGNIMMRFTDAQHLHKNRHYRDQTRKALGAAGYPSLVYSVPEDDPLQVFGLENLPLVTTPLGNMSRAFDKFLKRMATQAVHHHQASLPSPLPSLAHKIRRNQVHKSLRAAMACTTATAMVRSFSTDPSAGGARLSYRDLSSRHLSILTRDDVMIAVPVDEATQARTDQLADEEGEG